jgi:hypothetical protein
MSLTSIEFTINVPHQQCRREVVELWVPPYEEPTSEDYDMGPVPKRRCGEGSVIEWTRYDDDAWPIEPTPSDLITELSAAVGYLNKGSIISYTAHPYTSSSWVEGPDQDYLLYLEKKEVEEYCEAYDKWMNMIGDMDQDIHAPSYFSEYMGSVAKLDKDNKGFQLMKKMGWNGEGLGSSASGIEDPVHVDCANIIKDSTGTPKKLTPEMIKQRENLNWNFNFLWNNPHFTSIPENHDQELVDPWDQCVEVELVHIGEIYAVGKCEFGGVYIPNGVVRHLSNMECGKGGKFLANMMFTGGKFPWKIGYNGVVSVKNH